MEEDLLVVLEEGSGDVVVTTSVVDVVAGVGTATKPGALVPP